MRDYGKPVDVTSGNPLLFIAFNLTISGELPGLGYLTFLDVILISIFVVTSLVIIFNIVLKRLETRDREATVKRIDSFAVWIYPLAHIAAVLLVRIPFA